MVAWQQARGHVVEVAFGELTEPAEFEGSEIHIVPALRRGINPATDAVALRHLRRLTRAGAFDVVHTHQAKAGILGRVAARGVAPVLVHSLHMPSFGAGYSSAESAVFAHAERLCARFTDQFVAVGNELVELYLAAGIGAPADYSVIRSPVELRPYLDLRESTAEDRAAARRELSLDPEVPVAVVAGSLERRKRVALIVARLTPLLRDGLLQLLVAGDGPERAAIEAVVRGGGLDGRVRLRGHLPALTSAFQSADVLVHAARTEGVSQVILQALAAGLPVVATEVEGVREVAGAKVRVARRDGTDLFELVEASLSSGSESAPRASFDPWRVEKVEEELARFDEGLLRAVSAAAR